MKHEHFLSPKGFDDLADRLRVAGKGILMFPPAVIGDSITVKRAIPDIQGHWSRSMTLDVIEGSNKVTSPATVRARPTAVWELSLNLSCPELECEHEWDLVGNDGDPDFWESHRGLQICENGTDRSRDIEVSCPKCDCEFKVDLNY